MTRPRWWLFLLATAGCRPAVEAPEAIEEMMVFGFSHFDDPGHLEALEAPVFEWLDGATDQVSAEGYGVDSLTSGDLATAGVDDPDVEGVIGALGAAVYRIDIDQVADGVTHPRRPEIYQATVGWEILSHEGDRRCFLRRGCDAYRFTAEETNRIPVLGESRKTTTSELRWIRDEEGEVVALGMRQRTPDPIEFDSPIMAIDQQYGFTLLEPIPGGGTRRIEAFWIDARVLGLQLPEGFAVRQAVGRMQSSADDLDVFFLGEASE